MKYIRLFEKKVKSKYEIGDYIRLEGTGWNVCSDAKITDSGSNEHEENRTAREPDYFIETFEIESGKFVEFWVDESEIDRKLSEDEISSFEARKEANKYNL